MFDFKVLVKRHKGKDEGKIVWFYNILTGGGAIYQDWKMLAPVKEPLSPPLMDTGVKDVKGKPIYEGDLVKVNDSCYSELVGEVKFKHGAFYLDCPIQDENYKNTVILLFDCDSRDLEIVGNVYEAKLIVKIDEQLYHSQRVGDKVLITADSLHPFDYPYELGVALTFVGRGIAKKEIEAFIDFSKLFGKESFYRFVFDKENLTIKDFGKEITFEELPEDVKKEIKRG